MAWTFLFAPYLPLAERAHVEEWELVPRRGVAAADWGSREAEQLGKGLERLSRVRESVQRAGTWFRPPGGRLGDEFDAALIRNLRRSNSCRAACGQPVPAHVARPGVAGADPDSQLNAGWETYTSEHTQLWGHRIHPSGYVAEQRGSMVTELAGGFNVLCGDSVRFAAPRELHDPMLARTLDDEYASAGFRLGTGTRGRGTTAR